MLEGRDGEASTPCDCPRCTRPKGLEFPHVFLVGLEEGVLPHREAIDAGDVDEERRLMYVGVTRAQQSLHLSWCRTRKRAGARVNCVPSRFIGELAQEDLRYADSRCRPDEAAAVKARQRAAQVSQMMLA
jgi:ATP-dependent DNA helicase Rep